MTVVAQHLNRVSLGTLVQAAQSSDLDDTFAMNEVVRRFEPLALSLARSTTSNRHLQDDLANAARIGLVRAVRRHNPDQLGFPAFTEIYMRGAVIREYQSWLPPVIDEDTPIPPTDVAPPVEDVEALVLDRLAPWGGGAVAAAMAGLTPAQKRIAYLRYVEDAPLDRIAAEMGTGSSAVSQRLATIHRAVGAVIGTP